jgi:hypothetical protein
MPRSIAGRLLPVGGLAGIVLPLLVGCGSHVTDRSKSHLTVTVRDNGEGTRIKGAKVTCGGETRETDADGKVVFSSAPVGQQTLHVRATGYKAANVVITVTWPANRKTVYLDPAP